MIIKLSCGVAESPGRVVSIYSQADTRDFDPEAGKIIALDQTNFAIPSAIQETRECESRDGAKSRRARMRESLGAFLMDSLNLDVLARAVDGSEGRSDNSNTNIIDAGLGRRPSEFFPEAA